MGNGVVLRSMCHIAPAVGAGVPNDAKVHLHCCTADKASEESPGLSSE